MPQGTPAALLPAAEAEEVHVVFPEEVYRDLEEALFPEEESHPFYDMYERGAFCVVTRSTGHRRVSYLVRDVVHPESPNDLSSAHAEDPGSGSLGIFGSDDGGTVDSWEAPYGLGLRFGKDYHNRALERAHEMSAGIMRVHTHPGGVTPSPVDRRSAERVLGDDVNRLPLGAPLLDAITNDAGRWSARVYEFGSGDDPTVAQATAIRIVGPRFQKRPTPAGADGPAGAYGSINPEGQDSSMELWGQEGQEILSGLRIGLVGCGGVGSMLATHLPRLGIGGLVLVDFDRLKPANANRADGATDEDIEARRLKTDVAKREAKKAATAPNFEVTLVDGSVVEEDPVYAAVPDLLDCDIILCAVDAARPRKVLDHLASAHCIPVINGGSRLHVDTDGGLAPAAKIETSITGPGFPCFRCQRVWTSEDVEYERDDPRFRGDRTYVDGGVNPDQQPRSASVIGINSIVAGIIQQRLQGLALAISTRVVGIHRLNPGDLSAEWMGMELLFSCPDDCGRAPIAAGDGHRLPLGTDWAMRYERDDIPDPDTVTITPNEAEDLLSSDPE